MEVHKPISTIIIFIIAVVFVFLFLLPKYQESSALQASVIQKQAEYNGKSLYYTKITDLLSSIETRSDALAKVNSSLPENLELASLIYFFQKKGTENGLAVKLITFSQASLATPARGNQASTGKEIKNVIFSVNVVGSYQGLKNFLSALENSSRLFSVQTIAFTSLEGLQSSTAKNQTKTYDFKLEILTHTY